MARTILCFTLKEEIEEAVNGPSRIRQDEAADVIVRLGVGVVEGECELLVRVAVGVPFELQTGGLLVCGAVHPGREVDVSDSAEDGLVTPMQINIGALTGRDGVRLLSSVGPLSAGRL